MSTQAFHECEIKYKINSEQELAILRAEIEAKEFKLTDKRRETDFVPDVKGFVCKENGFMIRFRNIISDSRKDILITMKVKGKATGFQEYFEYEYSLSNFKQDVFDSINEKLMSVTGFKIPAEINKTTDFMEIIRIMRASEFTEHRIILEKDREEYKKTGSTISIDLLPEGIGYFMEIETQTPEELMELVESFKLNKDLLITDNYGSVLKNHKRGSPEILMRTGLFDKNYKDYGIEIQN